MSFKFTLLTVIAFVLDVSMDRVFMSFEITFMSGLVITLIAFVFDASTVEEHLSRVNWF